MGKLCRSEKPQPFQNSDLYNAQSVDYLHKVLSFFKEQGRTVYVMGASYGALLVQETMAKKLE